MMIDSDPFFISILETLVTLDFANFIRNCINALTLTAIDRGIRPECNHISLCNSFLITYQLSV